VRHFATSERSRLRWLCDLNENTLARHAKTYRETATTVSFEEVLRDPVVDAVAVATPAPTHFTLALQALEAGKHVYVEKPMTLSAADAAVLTHAAERADRRLMVGHLLEYHPAVRYLKQLIEDDRLGDIHYLYAQRVNLGIVRSEENAWWSLAPHDLSIICYLFDAEPVRITLSGQCFLQPDIEDVVFGTLDFADGRLAHVHVSWLDPHKVRKVTIVGTERMATFDDMEAAEKVRLYDKGASMQPSVADYGEAIQVRMGDILIPRIPPSEPLRLEVRHFIDAVLDGTPILSDGHDGERVVRILEAGARSLRRGGVPTPVPPPGGSGGSSGSDDDRIDTLQMKRIGASPRRIASGAAGRLVGRAAPAQVLSEG